MFKEAKALAEALPKTRLMEINMTYGEIRDEEMSILAEALPLTMLRKLHLRGIRIEEKRAIAFAQVVNNQLRGHVVRTLKINNFGQFLQTFFL